MSEQIKTSQMPKEVKPLDKVAKVILTNEIKK